MKRTDAIERSTIDDVDPIDEIVEQFELTWNGATNPPSIADFLPPESAPHFRSSATELIRVDIERRYATGNPIRLSAYVNSFDWLRTHRDELTQLAFEEYRQRRAAGDDVSPDNYSDLFEIDTSTWPQDVSAEDTNAFHEWNASTYGLLREDTDRLIDSLATMPDVGDSFGNFTIVEELGKGAFARVYLAKQNDLAKREVSIKVAPELWSESDKLARLQHTNIMPIYSMHEIGQLNALCMPFLGRETLADRLGKIDAGARLFDDEKALACFAAKLADALTHAHTRNIVHRDLKPANILIDDTSAELEPLILDFNLSDNVVVGGPTSQLVGGTLPYMSPEQLRAILSRDRLTPATDVYSLGVLLFQMVTGRLPFNEHRGNFADSVIQMAKDRRTDKRWQNQLDQDASPDMASIIRRCLEPSVENRYSQASDLREDLIRHASDQPLSTAKNRSLVQTVSKWSQRNRHRLTLGTISAMAAVLIASALAFGLWQQSRTLRADAERNAAQFDNEFLSLSLGLQSKTAPGLKKQSAAEAQRWADRFGVLEGDRPEECERLGRLASKQRSKVQSRLGELMFLWSESGHVPDNTSPERIRTVAGQLLVGNTTSAWKLDDLPASPSRKQLLVADHIKQGRYREALKILEEAIQSGSRQDSLWLHRGICQEEAGNPAAGELSFTHYIALMPEDPIGYFHRGRLRLNQKDPGGALRDFDRVLELRPRLPSGQLNRAIALYHLGRAGDATAQLEQINDPGPLSYRVLMLQSRIAGDSGNEDAKSSLDETLLKAKPASAIGWVHRALMQRTTSPDDAIADLERALMQEPNYREALQNLAAMYTEVKRDHEKARDVLDAWSGAFPDDPIPFASRAVLYARDGALEDAMEQIEQSRARGANAECLYYRACALAQLTKIDPDYANDAIDEMRLCLNLDQDSKWFDQAIRDPDLVPLTTNKEFGRLFAAARLMNEGPTPKD